MCFHIFIQHQSEQVWDSLLAKAKSWNKTKQSKILYFIIEVDVHNKALGAEEPLSQNKDDLDDGYHSSNYTPNKDQLKE